MVDVRGDVLRPPHGTTPAAVKSNKNPLRAVSEFCSADYVSKVHVIYPKGNKLPEKIEEKNDDDNNNEK